MLTISNVSKSYGGRTLYEAVSLQINRRDRLGLVGPNGAGKSTLFSIILGHNEPDSGSVTMERGTTLGFLPQESAPVSDETVLQLATAVPDLEEYERMALEPKAKRILAGLAFRESDLNREARTLSGGWVMRAHLARLLVQEPDLLMLDEPTNHLDLESLGWFQNYLQSYPGAILMISHDRAFLNALCDGIVDVRHGKLSRYRGNYDAYVEQRAARQEQQWAAYRNQQKEIAALQEFADRFRAKASKASQAQSKLKQIERMEKIEAPESEEKTISFRFPQPPRSGQRVAELKGVRQGYGETIVYENLNFEAQRGDRTVLVGPNGAGKSTLLKILAGVVPIAAGERELGHQVKVGYFTQHRVEMLEPSNTVLQEVMRIEKPPAEQAVRSVLGSFLFRGDDVYKTVRVLSGGEKSRLALVKLLLDPPNLLLMDEPTTHLDMGSIDALIGALKQYEGTLVFISHDVYFIRALATSVLHVSRGQVNRYAGDYQYYLDKSRATSERGALVAGEKLSDHRGGVGNNKGSGTSNGGASEPRPAFKTKEQKRAEAEARQARARMKRELESQITGVEAEIAAVEREQERLTQELSAPETYQQAGRAAEINRTLAQVATRLEGLFSKWDKISSQLERFEADDAATEPEEAEREETATPTA